MGYLQLQQKEIKESIDKRIAKVLSHGHYILGPEVYELEETLSHYTDTRHCITCSSGTDALLMSLMAYNVQKGDLILTTPFTFIATAEVISLLGAIPIFVDINEHTFNIEPSSIIKHIEQTTSEIKGIISVDIFGNPVEYDIINKIANTYNLFFISDAAQSFGAKFQGHRIGGLADITTTSFFPTKPLGCYGDGGAIFTNDDHIAQTLRSIREHGRSESKYNNIIIGINGRLDTIQAAILLAKLEVFDNELTARQAVADYYIYNLPAQIKSQQITNRTQPAWAQFCVLNKDREKLNIKWPIYYPIPLHLQPVFKYLGHKKGDFPISEEISSQIFSLPMHPYLTQDKQEQILSLILQ